MKDDLNSKIWLKLREPFELSENLYFNHKCDWEIFDDIGKAGCLKCGFIHICKYGMCTDITETNDGAVCNITGVQIRTKCFAVNEFDTNYTSYSQMKKVISCDSDKENLFQIRDLVHNILLSTVAIEVHELENMRILNRIILLIPKMANENFSFNSFTGLIKQHLKKKDFQIQNRFTLLKDCSEKISDVIAICKKNLNMRIKQSDFKGMCIGILYLMRVGVHVQGINVIPKVQHMEDVLPPENYLGKYFRLSAKNITDCENRLKFALRSISKKDLQKINL